MRGSEDTSRESKAENGRRVPRSWSCGVLNDKILEEVPGTVLLLPPEPVVEIELEEQKNGGDRNSLQNHIKPSTFPGNTSEPKRTSDGIILAPQPDESPNDPLNWPLWRRNAALFSLGLYCALGGGMTPLLAAGFHNVAHSYHVSVPKVALTTGLFMLGLGVGGIIFSPTAILFGKRAVYLATAVMLIGTSIWCAVSPNYTSLLLARIFQGVAVSPVEVLASATVTEIFFLHERAFRLGIYTLLLLSGKNLMPLISAVIIQRLGWRSVFWAMALAVGIVACLLVLFLPETFWDRTPQPETSAPPEGDKDPEFIQSTTSETPLHGTGEKSDYIVIEESQVSSQSSSSSTNQPSDVHHCQSEVHFMTSAVPEVPGQYSEESMRRLANSWEKSKGVVVKVEDASDFAEPMTPESGHNVPIHQPNTGDDSRRQKNNYTEYYRRAPMKTYVQTLSPYLGRISYENWFRVAIRPFILFAYPSVLWSALVYSLSIGWLVVLSECISEIYRNRNTYNFSAFQTGLVYLSAFTGGVLGTAIAGKASDFAVRFMARRNGGVYEPEFRLVMTIPVAISSVIGLMGFGWSVQVRDAWIVPTFFFGLISFGCSLGSTTAITFCVDSYREYAGEALVTLNFSKNIFHGLMFSLFFPEWLEAKGSKQVFVTVGVLQLGCLLFTIPMFIYGKRARSWTARCDMMRKY